MLLLLTGLSILGLTGYEDRNTAYPAVGDVFPLPAIERIEWLDGHQPGFGDKTLLINFWATWCAPCRREMPDLQKLSETLDREKYAVIGISVDEDRNLAEEFLLDNRIRFANYWDHGQLISSELLGIEAFPATYIVAPDGSILDRINGEQTWNEASFEASLNGRKLDGNLPSGSYATGERK